MEDLGGKQEKTAGWELVRLLRFGEDDDGGDDDDDDDDDDAGDKDCVLVIIMVFILIIFLQGGREVRFHIGGCTGGKDEIQMGIKQNINILYLYYSTQSKMIFEYLNIEYLHFSIS